MTRRLPLCAHCGGSLHGTSTSMRLYYDLPGKPEIGWHLESGCTDADPFWRWSREGISDGRPPADDAELAARLRDIEARGPGRLVAGPAWERAKAKGDVRRRPERTGLTRREREVLALCRDRWVSEAEGRLYNPFMQQLWQRGLAEGAFTSNLGRTPADRVWRATDAGRAALDAGGAR